jgi:uncharacterized membrane protein (DUF2068 family)
MSRLIVGRLFDRVIDLASPSMASASHRRRPTLVRLIGGLKLVKAVVLAAVAVGLMTNHALRSLVWRVVGYWSERALHAAGIVTALYAVVFAVEGVGLLLARRWAEWLTVLVTASFIPLEIWKIVRHPGAPGLVTLALNLAIAAYLAVRLARHDDNGALASRHALR